MPPKKKEPRVYCSVMSCKVTSVNSPGTHFYSFPSLPHRLERRQIWIAAVRNHSTCQRKWLPNMYSRICSHHFVGNKKSNNPSSPSYNPTIFSGVCRKKKTAVKEQRSKRKDSPNEEEHQSKKKRKTQLDNENLPKSDIGPSTKLTAKRHKKSQANFKEKLVYHSLYNFSCKLYITDTTCEAEVQTSLQSVIKIGRKNINPVNKSTNTDFRTHDKSCGPETTNYDRNNLLKRLVTYEISSITSDRDMLSITGTTLGVFHMLLKILNRSNLDDSKLPLDKSLLIFLMRMKTGLPFSAISSIVGAEKTTVSRTFYITLMFLAAACKKFVFWPSREIVQGTMPDNFKQSFKDCRVIIDCFEMPVDRPSSDKLTVQFYSNSTNRFTIKVLVGFTPTGLVSFISRCYPGATTDTEIVKRCGILNFLNAGDTIIADKAFLAIKETVENNKKDINVVKLSFTDTSSCSEDKSGNSEQIRKIKMDLKKKVRRMRAYELIKNLQVLMYPDSDSILFMCAVLVNCQISRQL